jgi:mannose-6-phosphate isomerase-like protein (cupin superfamily)
MPVVHTPSQPTHELGATRFTSIATPSCGATDTAVWQVEIAPGTPPTPHSMTREEVFVVLEGTASVRLDDVQASASAPDAIVVPAGVGFELWNEGPAVLRLLCCMPVGGQARLEDGTVFTPPWAQ